MKHDPEAAQRASVVPARLLSLFNRKGCLPAWLLTVAEYGAVEAAGWIRFRAADGGFAFRPLSEKVSA